MTVQTPSEVTVVAPTSMPVTVAEEIQAPAGRKNCIISYAVNMKQDVIVDSFTPGENCKQLKSCREQQTCLEGC